MISRGTVDLVTWLRRHVVDEEEADIITAANGATPDAVRQALGHLERRGTLVRSGSRWQAAAAASAETPPVDAFEASLLAELAKNDAFMDTVRTDANRFADAHTHQRSVRWCLDLYRRHLTSSGASHV